MAVKSLRKAAEGKPCILCGDTATTSLHHIRVGQNGGMGKKPPDIHGIEVCRLHHAYFHSEGINDHKMMLIAYQRQVSRWIERGLLTVAETNP